MPDNVVSMPGARGGEDYVARPLGEPDPDAQVEAAQAFVRRQEPRIRPQERLDAEYAEPLPDEAALAYTDDAAYRRRLARESGGSVSAFEGVEVSEATDPEVQKMLVAFLARTRAEAAVEAMQAFEASIAVRTGYRLYQARLWAQQKCREFWVWMRR